ncbi:MAG: phenylalanine--tRNA ligase subunit alpha [Planctomycetota bacterium]
MDELHRLRDQALQAIEAAPDLDRLEAARVRYLGRKGRLKELTGRLADLPNEEKPAAGRLANEVKTALTEALGDRQAALAGAAPGPAGPALDVTLPGSPRRVGTRHPITQMYDELVEAFARLGFETAYGPEIEDEYHNFDALNIPPDHPSRDAFDTFYIDDERLLRSHTSPVQIRVMETRQPPIRIVAPGKVFRPDTVDASHYPMFFQLEGLYVDEGVTFADLKAVLTMSMQEVLGAETRTRFRPSFFPFTEPSAEVDVSCPFCTGTGCSVCGQSGWIEMLGCGMVDPEVFHHVGYDAERYTGFAFGIGIDRVAMTRLGIDDIRLFYENDVRFLKQF